MDEIWPGFLELVVRRGRMVQRRSSEPPRQVITYGHQRGHCTVGRLALGAASVGSGVRTMRFVAMMGFESEPARH